MLDSNERAVEGDNKSPAFDLEKVDAHKLTLVEFNDKAKAWLKLEKIEDEKMAERLTDFVSGARTFSKNLEDDRKAEKKPYDEAAAEVQGAYTPMQKAMKTMADKTKALLGAYLDEKQKREAAEKEKLEREAREAEEAACKELEAAAADNDILAEQAATEKLEQAEADKKTAAKPLSKSVGSATGAGRTISTRTVRTAEITSINLCFMHHKDNPAVKELLTRLSTADVRSDIITEGNAPSKGVKILKTKTAG